MDINQVITLGIGTPADIPHFILVGLSPLAVPPEVVDRRVADFPDRVGSRSNRPLNLGPI